MGLLDNMHMLGGNNQETPKDAIDAFNDLVAERMATKAKQENAQNDVENTADTDSDDTEKITD